MQNHDLERSLGQSEEHPQPIIDRAHPLVIDLNAEWELIEGSPTARGELDPRWDRHTPASEETST